MKKILFSITLSLLLFSITACENNNNDNIVENTQFSVNKGINNDLKLKLEENNISVYPVEKERVKDVKVRSGTKYKLGCTSKGRRGTSEKSQ